MRNILALTSVLALALSAPALAQKHGDDKGGDRGHGKSLSGGKAEKGKAQKNHDKRAAKSDRSQKNNMGNTERYVRKDAKHVSKANGKEGKERFKSGKGEAGYSDGFNKAEQNASKSDHRKSFVRRYDERGDRDRFQFSNDDDRRRFAVRYDEDFGPLSGFCPSGLAKKGNGCQPPGQAKKIGKNDRYFLSNYSRLGGGDWQYYNGYAYQNDASNNLISAFLPLVGGALFGGNTWPTAYQDYRVPQYYDNYYGRDDDYSYRYADRTIFSVDPRDQGIEGIVALLTGNDFDVGRRMPAGYDLYNVPTQYREQYYDRPDAQYRYSDGYVYQVDPKTRLIAAVIELIV